MRVLFVVQRYGVEVAGGAEQSARLLATHLVEAGHEVHVLTSRAVSSLTWDNAYPPGSSELDGVAVHRLATAGPRDEELFDELSRCVLWSGRPAAPVVQEAWLRAQGPVLPDLEPWLRERAERFDAIDFFIYLFCPTWAGLAAVGSRLPTVLHAAP
ncbi:MAG: glycosyl transferase family 1, partial [Acidimicrobiales bacterium]